MTDKPKFALAIRAFQEAEYQFKTALEGAGFSYGDHYDGIRWDEYDNSIEFDCVSNDVRLTEEQQRIIYDAGFSRAFVNHEDKWESHYSWSQGEPFKAARGWRRRYVSDPAATTTNVVAGPPNPGYYEISYWPEGWKSLDWLETGYMRVVPDPLEPRSNE